MSADKADDVRADEKSVQELSNDKTETLRMWSAISFSLLILGVGIPLWWKTTEVYRVALPFAEIEELQQIKPLVLVNLSVHAGDRNRVLELKSALASSRLFDLRLTPGESDCAGTSVAELEEMDSKRPSTAESFMIIETNRVAEETVVVGNHRSLYFHPNVKTAVIADVVKKWILRESYLEDMVGSLEEPGSRTGQERRLKSEPCFDIVFTTVNPDPSEVRVSFDSEFSMVNVIQPLLRQLTPSTELKVKSQWLYLVDIGQEPKIIPDRDGYAIAFDRIPHIISPLEKKLGSGVSRCPCLHFVLYVPRCSQAPLYFTSADNSLETAVVSPKWGGIQLLNPSRDNCVNNTFMTPDISSVARVFVSHLRYLLDLKYEALPDVKLLTLNDAPLREWEVDSLHRSRVLEQAISARLTLQSLSRLLGEISNIVINEEVGDAIKTSMLSISATFSRLSSGLLQDALESARRAYVTAEMAFSHPSLLALLYFPDDQKYAVYIPLFLPVMIPVILSLKNVWKWMNNK